MAGKKAQQANLFQVDLDAVWRTFLEGSDWSKVTLDEERDALTEARGKLEEQMDALQSQHALLSEQIEGLSSREKRAREHLEKAAKQMGVFGTEAVLLTSLRGAFPPTLFERATGAPHDSDYLVAHPCRRAKATPAATAPAGYIAPTPALDPHALLAPDSLSGEQSSRKVEQEPGSPLELVVLDVLDHEGMTAGDILKRVRRDERMSPETTSDQLAKATRRLAKQKKIVIEGERRSKTYRLAGE
jgi:hypothetical protein